jgi:hypothetical protein
LSFETTPTLCHSVPAFESFMQKWEECRDDAATPAQFCDVIQAGLDKLEDYQGRIDDTPAYVLAMGDY